MSLTSLSAKSRASWFFQAIVGFKSASGRIALILAIASIAQTGGSWLWYWQPDSPGYHPSTLKTLAAGSCLLVLVVFLKAFFLLAAVDKRGFSDALKRAILDLPVLILVEFTYLILVAAGLIALVVPGILLSIRLSLASIEVVLYRRRPLDAFRASYHRTAGQSLAIATLFTCYVASAALFQYGAAAALDLVWSLPTLLNSSPSAFAAVALLRTMLTDFLDTAYGVFLFFFAYRVLWSTKDDVSCSPQKTSPPDSED